MDGVAGLFGAGVLLLGGIAMLVLAKRSADGTLRPNGMAGVRTQLTMSSDDAWYAAQAAAAGATSVAGWGGIAFAVLAAGVAFLPIGEAVNWLILVCVLLGAAWVLAWMVVGTNRGARAAEHAAR